MNRAFLKFIVYDIYPYPAQKVAIGGIHEILAYETSLFAYIAYWDVDLCPYYDNFWKILKDQANSNPWHTDPRRMLDSFSKELSSWMEIQYFQPLETFTMDAYATSMNRCFILDRRPPGAYGLDLLEGTGCVGWDGSDETVTLQALEVGRHRLPKRGEVPKPLTLLATFRLPLAQVVEAFENFRSQVVALSREKGVPDETIGKEFDASWRETIRRLKEAFPVGKRDAFSGAETLPKETSISQETIQQIDQEIREKFWQFFEERGATLLENGKEKLLALIPWTPWPTVLCFKKPGNDLIQSIAQCFESFLSSGRGFCRIGKRGDYEVFLILRDRAPASTGFEGQRYGVISCIDRSDVIPRIGEASWGKFEAYVHILGCHRNTIQELITVGMEVDAIREALQELQKQ